MGPDGVEYHINEADLRQIHEWVNAIRLPTVAYSEDRLEMANRVIAKSRYLADLIRDKLPQVEE